RLPASASGLGAVTGVQGIHLIGGRRTAGFFGWRIALSPEHLLFTPRLGRFRRLAPLPTPRETMALVLLHDQIYTLGGQAGIGAIDEHERYDLAEDGWRPQPSLHVPIAGPAAAGVGETLWLVGAPGSQGPLVETRDAANSYLLYRRLATTPHIPAPHSAGTYPTASTELPPPNPDTRAEPPPPPPDLGELDLSD
ncbi:MAG: kelch repeat-containing protein, partial [Holophagales bacterium]|nr:kelch repeat-containing protein [Holophagales bacterium]